MQNANKIKSRTIAKQGSVKAILYLYHTRNVRGEDHYKVEGQIRRNAGTLWQTSRMGVEEEVKRMTEMVMSKLIEEFKAGPWQHDKATSGFKEAIREGHFDEAIGEK